MRSAKAPTISAGVMQAKVIWKQMKTIFGDDDAVGEGRRRRCRRDAREEHLGEAAEKALVAAAEGEASSRR